MKRKKRVLCFIDSLVSGGAQRQLVGLAKLLFDDGYDVEVVTYHDLSFYKSFLDQNGVSNKCLKKAANKYTRIIHTYKEFKRFNPDVVISYLDSPSIIACIIKKLMGGFKLIVSERNTTQVLSRKEKMKFFLYKNADYIVPNSHSQEIFIKQNFPSLSSKVKTITNFVDIDYFSPVENKEIHDVCEVVCVGRIDVQKNILRFLDALKIVKDKVGSKFRVKWYGGKFDYYYRCMDKVKENHLEDVFEFHEPTKLIRDCYRKSDVFCLPSIYEGFPNVLCEAMCCGLPVLCSNVCDNPMIAEDGVNGFLFDPHNIDDMSNSILAFLKLSSDERLAMGNESRNISERKFTSETFLSKYEEII